MSIFVFSLTAQWLPEVTKPEGKDYSVHRSESFTTPTKSRKTFQTSSRSPPGWSLALTPVMNRTTFCLPTSSCPVETAMTIRSLIWPKVKSEHFFSGQGWVWLSVWEDWGWPENQPRRRGLMFIYLWIIDHHLSGQVNRARYMPQNPSVIATKTPTSEVAPAFT